MDFINRVFTAIANLFGARPSAHDDWAAFRAKLQKMESSVEDAPVQQRPAKTNFVLVEPGKSPVTYLDMLQSMTRKITQDWQKPRQQTPVISIDQSKQLELHRLQAHSVKKKAVGSLQAARLEKLGNKAFG